MIPDDREVKELLDRLKKQSIEYYVPLIDAEDGAALASLAFLAPKGVFADLGAGIGYSTLWLALGARGRRDKDDVKIIAVEWDSDLAEALIRNSEAITRLTGVKVEVINEDAIDYLDKLPTERVFSLAFVDIEKNLYHIALRKLIPRTLEGGIIAFHNAYFPRPPRAFYEEISKYKHVIIPTPQGLAVISL